MRRADRSLAPASSARVALPTVATSDVQPDAGELPADRDGEAPPSPADHPEPKSLREIAADLWRPRSAAGRSAAGSEPHARTTKELVNGLERNELAIGAALMVAQLAITIVDYAVWHHSHDLKYRQIAPDALVAGLVGTAIMALGVGLRRRALLGFAAFIVGMESISFGDVLGLVYLVFGGWLIMRVMRLQRQAKAKAAAVPAAGSRRSTPSTRSGRAAPSGPKPSKRYTPPQRTASGRRR